MNGHWVWCPEGWKCVPKQALPEIMYSPRFELLSTSYSDMVENAPEPPSGWRQDTPPRGEPILAQRWAEKTFEVITTYTSGAVHGYWWTPLPPPPEVKP